MMMLFCPSCNNMFSLFRPLCFLSFVQMKSANSNATSYDVQNGNSTILGMPKLDGDNNVLVASNLATVLMEMRMNKSKNKLI